MPKFSAITCSIDPQKYGRMRQSLQAAMGEDFESILIPDAGSLSEGYQRGAALASGALLIFCHDDLQFLGTGLGALLRQDLQDFDLVGVCGASRLTSGKWVSAGYPHLHGQIAHQPGAKGPFRLTRYGCGREGGLVAGIRALDGVFFAARREPVTQVGFDSQTFDGFHLYDLDFSWRAQRAGFKLAVDHRIQMVHHSSGNFDANWNRYKYLFQKKFKGQLDPVIHSALPFYLNQEVQDFASLQQKMAEGAAPKALFCDFQDGTRTAADERLTSTTGAWERLSEVEPNSLDFLQIRASDALAQAHATWQHQAWRALRHGAILELQQGTPEMEASLTQGENRFLRLTPYATQTLLFQALKSP